MFFKSKKDHDMISTNIAFYCIFVFWAGFLLINSFLTLVNKDIQINSLYLLLSGLLVFFTTERIAFYIRRKKRLQSSIID